jgi:hypothetical protein
MIKLLNLNQIFKTTKILITIRILEKIHKRRLVNKVYNINNISKWKSLVSSWYLIQLDRLH